MRTDKGQQYPPSFQEYKKTVGSNTVAQGGGGESIERDPWDGTTGINLELGLASGMELAPDAGIDRNIQRENHQREQYSRSVDHNSSTDRRHGVLAATMLIGSDPTPNDKKSGSRWS